MRQKYLQEFVQLVKCKQFRLARVARKKKNYLVAYLTFLGIAVLNASTILGSISGLEYLRSIKRDLSLL